MTVDEIKSTYSMKDIVEMYGFKMTRSGFICCPIHKEKTASMKIYPDSYYCFGCGHSGDVFKFVQEVDKVSFREAFKRLGGTYDHDNSNAYFINKYRLEQAKKQRKQKEEQEQRKKQELITEIGKLERLQKRVEGSDMWFDIQAKLENLNYKLDYLNGFYD